MATQHETIITCDWCGEKQALTEAERATEADLPDGWAYRDNEDLCGVCAAARALAIDLAKREAPRSRAAVSTAEGRAHAPHAFVAAEVCAWCGDTAEAEAHKGGAS